MNCREEALQAIVELKYDRAIAYAILSLGDSGLEPVAEMAHDFVNDPTSDNFKKLAKIVEEIVG
jgi:hypothetical protein